MTPHRTGLKQVYCTEWPERRAIFVAKAAGKPVLITLWPAGDLAAGERWVDRIGWRQTTIWRDRHRAALHPRRDQLEVFRLAFLLKNRQTLPLDGTIADLPVEFGPGGIPLAENCEMREEK
jgi:hypothetical protein